MREREREGEGEHSYDTFRGWDSEGEKRKEVAGERDSEEWIMFFKNVCIIYIQVFPPILVVHKQVLLNTFTSKDISNTFVTLFSMSAIFSEEYLPW